ncbi:18S rRNA maturation protein [Umbelopsis sp. WA50703]
MAPNLKRKNKEVNDEIPSGNAAIKKKIRDTTRALSRDNLSAKVKIELERKLKALKFHSSEKMIDDVERNNAKKYHMVKHFERTKVNRKIKKAEKQLKEADTEESKKDAQKILDVLNIDLNYINHYPNVERYISLYPSQDSDEKVSNEEVSTAMRTEIRQRIAEAMKNGDIESDVVRKHYREKYRDHLVKTGKIPAIEASADDFINTSENSTEDKSKPAKKAKVDKKDKKKTKLATSEEDAHVKEDDFFV